MFINALRISAGLVFMFIAGFTILPNFNNYISSSAVVNAPILTLSMPFEGQVVAPSSTRGTAVESGVPLFVARASRPDMGFVLDHISERADLEGQHEAILEQAENLEARRADFVQRLETHRDAAGAWLAERIAETEADYERAVAREAMTSAEVDRFEALLESGAVAAALYDQSITEMRIAEADMDGAQARIQGLQIAKDNLTNDVFLGENMPSLDYIRRRIDEIDLRINDARTDAARLLARISALEARIETAQAAHARDNEYAPIPGDGMVVWSPSPGQDAIIASNGQVAQLLDCSRRFVEAALPERLFESLDEERRVEVQLKGSTEWYSTRIRAVRGSGISSGQDHLATHLSDVENDHLITLIDLPAVNVNEPSVARSFCDVGRSAQVRLPRQSVSNDWVVSVDL